MEEGLTEEESPEESSESKEEEEEQKTTEIKELSEYQVLEKNYRDVLSQLEKTEGMENFSQEYTKIFEALYKSHVHEEALLEENTLLHAKAESDTLKLKVTEELAITDKQTIDELRNEIANAWKMVDSAHAREQNAQEIIKNLREQINRLNIEIEQRVRLGLDQTDESGSKKDKENIMRERERLMHEVVILRERLTNATNMQEDLEREVSTTDQRCKELAQELENQTNEVNKEIRVKERLEQELKDLSSQLEAKNIELSSLQIQFSHSQRSIEKLEGTVKDTKGVNERLVKDIENLNIRLSKLQIDLELQIEITDKLTQDNSAKVHQLKLQEEEITKLHNESTKIEKIREQYTKKLTISENQRGELEKEKEKFKSLIGSLEHELDIAKKQADKDKKVSDSLQREREILNKNILKAAGAAYEQQKIIELQNQVKKNLQQEIENYNIESNKLRKAISSLEKERDRIVLETQELNQNVQDALDEVKLKQMAILDYKKKLADEDSKFHMQQNLFEAVRSDRNNLSKLLLEAQDEISEFKQKLKVMTHQIEQLKEDITTKETQLMKEEFALQKSEKEKENLKVELKKMKNELQESKEQIVALNLEERKLHKLIQDADEESQKQKKEMDQIMNERDILGSQLVRRNDELSLLYEKINILQNILQIGETHYDQRLDDIRLLKLEIKRLRQEKNLLSRNVTNMTDMRQEIFHLERDLTREKLKFRALEEELQSPLNIHRWRKLEGSDPTQFELIKKIQLLQKRLLKQAENSIKQEAQLQEALQINKNLRQLLARQPGPESAIQLQETRQALKNRGKKMKCLLAELNMYEAQVGEYKFDLVRVSEELQGVKKKYFKQKRREQKLKERESELANSNILPPINNGKNRFIGGGFNLSAIPTKPPDN